MTEIADIETVVEEIEILLRRCSEDELKNIAVDLEIDNVDKLTRRKVLRAIENAIAMEEETNKIRLLKDLDFP